jgi:hydroxypyruvate isomerase
VIRWSAHVSMLFTEVPATDRPAAARDAGFELIESWWPPADDPAAWARAVIAAGIGVACLNADGGDIAAGDRGFCNLPERDADTFAAAAQALALAERVGAPCVNVLPGLVAAHRPRDEQVDHAVAVYRELGVMAAASGRTIVVEPINAVDVPHYLLPTADAVADLVRRVDHPNVRMLFDAYHCARSGGDPIAEAAAHVGLIGHVQYADHPGRGAPGTGDISINALRSALEEAGYGGAIGLEFDPQGPTPNALGALSM